MEKQNLLNPESWSQKYSDYLYNYALSRLFNKDIALDLVQETFLSALKAIDGFKGTSSEKTWLVSILKHKIIDHFRKTSRRKENQSLDEDLFENKPKEQFISEGDMEGAWNLNRAPQQWNNDAIQNIEQEELQKVLQHCLDRLPQNWKGIFTLKTIEEIDTDDVCKEYNISASNLWVILHRARLQLRECIERVWLKER